jgi:tetratricopeptide (TPR) repeat protein
VRLGLVQNLSKQPAEALENFKKALELNPQQLDALTQIVGVYVRQKKFEEALTLCEKQKGKVGDRPSSIAVVEYLEGNVFLAKKDVPKAEEKLRAAIEKNPDMLSSYMVLAQIYGRGGQVDKAISQFETVLKRNPKYLPGYMVLGAIYDQRGDMEKASSYYRKALEIKKDFGPAANNLAWNLVANGGNIDEALGLAQIAKEQMPENAAVMDTLGWIYYQKGSYLNAIAELQDSLERSPDNPVINYHLGMAYYKNNETENALKSLQKALDLNADFKGAEEARRAIKEIKASTAQK